MKKISWKILIITCLICLLPIIAGIIYYPDLPEQMAVHFDINNQPDNYMSKNFALFGIPIALMLLQTFCCIISDIRQREGEKQPKFFIVVKWFVPTLSLLLSFSIIRMSLGINVDIRRMVCIILGLLFILMGNYFPKMSYESIKWKMHPMPKNEKAYRKMAKGFGFLFVIGGSLLLFSVFFESMYSIAVLVTIIIAIIIKFIYYGVINHQ